MTFFSTGAETSQDAMAYARKEILAPEGPPGCKNFIGLLELCRDRVKIIELGHKKLGFTHPKH